MAWRRPGDKPLSEPIMVSLLTHICVTRPQWVQAISNKLHLSTLDITTVYHIQDISLGSRPCCIMQPFIHVQLCKDGIELQSFYPQTNITIYSRVLLYQGPTKHDFAYGTTMTEAKYASEVIFTKYTPYLALMGSYVVSFVRISLKINHIITAPDCNMSIFPLSFVCLSYIKILLFIYMYQNSYWITLIDTLQSCCSGSGSIIWFLCARELTLKDLG